MSSTGPNLPCLPALPHLRHCPERHGHCLDGHVHDRHLLLGTELLQLAQRHRELDRHLHIRQQPGATTVSLRQNEGGGVYTSLRTLLFMRDWPQADVRLVLALLLLLPRLCARMRARKPRKLASKKTTPLGTNAPEGHQPCAPRCVGPDSTSQADRRTLCQVAPSTRGRPGLTERKSSLPHPWISRARSMRLEGRSPAAGAAPCPEKVVLARLWRDDQPRPARCATNQTKVV